jgi:transcriptional regulator with XRE-family HTH domain
MTPEQPSDQVRKAIDNLADLGISRYRLSQATGVSQSALSRFMAGEQPRGLTLVSLDALAPFLDIQIRARKRIPKDLLETS